MLSPTPRTVTLRSFQPDPDSDLLSAWLARPHVRRWWGDPDQQLALCLDRSQTRGHVLICVNNQPVGYLRWQQVDPEDLQALGLDHIPEGAVDMDILIGEMDWMGQGIGPQAIELMVDQLRQDLQAPMVGMTTSVENGAAIRAYEKAGFQKLMEYEDPSYGLCWIMVIEFGVRESLESESLGSHQKG